MRQADSLCITVKQRDATMYTHPSAYADFDARRNPAEPFEWEELPSLTNVVLRRHVPTGSYTLAAELVAEARGRFRSEPSVSPCWLETTPAALDPLTPSGPLQETELGGLDAREIIEPDVFRHFFGANAAR
jgi:hypothetical protein